MKKTCFCILSLLILLLTSCENFMNAGDVQKEIENAVNKANAKSFNLVISQDTSMGSFLSSGEKECKLGYSINVQFNVKKDSFIFKGLKAVSTSNDEVSRNDCINFTTLESDSDRGIYKLSIQLLKEATDILILPDCTQVPGVVKDDCFPSFDAGGWEQDSTIKIAFNKPITLLETFSLVITDTAGVDMSSYYAEPYLSSDKQFMFIPINKKKHILEPNGAIPTKDIVVKIDLTNIQDEDQNTGNGIFEYKFRVKKAVDTQIPSLSGAALFTSSNTADPFYKAISSKDYQTWQGNETSHGDYDTFHVSGKLYFELTGTDEGSGISGIVVKEILKKFNDGTNGPADAPEYHAVCTLNEETGKYECNYTLNTPFDGIIELQVSLEDYAGNISSSSQVKKFWVLKDTLIDSSLIKFKQEIGGFQDTDEEWLKAIPSNINGNSQTVNLTFGENVTDLFYDQITSPFNIEVTWWDSENSSPRTITKSNNQYTFTRDINCVAYIKLNCSDSVGNKKEIIKIMDPRPEIESFSSDYTSSEIRLKDFVKTNVLTQNTSVDNYQKTRVVIYYYTDAERTNLSHKYIQTGSDLVYSIKNGYSNNLPWNEIIPMEGNVTYYTSSYLITRFGDFVSPLSVNHVNCCISEWNGNTFAYGEEPYLAPVSNTSGADTEIVSAYSKFIGSSIKIRTEAIQNAGAFKVTISDYKGAVPTAADGDISYKFHLICYEIQDNAPDPDWEPNPDFVPTEENPFDIPDQVTVYKFDTVSRDSVSTNNPVFYLKTPGKYILFIEVTGPQGHYYSAALPDRPALKQLPTCTSFYLNSATQTTNILDLTADLTSPQLKPVMGPLDTYSYMFSPAYYEIDFPYDEQGNIYINSNEKGELTYYIIPDAGNNVKSTPNYSSTELQTFYSSYAKVIEYNVDSRGQGNDSLIRIPFGNLKDGFYTICFVTRDKYNNYSSDCFPCINRCIGLLPVTITRGSGIQISIDNPSNYYFSYVDSQNYTYYKPKISATIHKYYNGEWVCYQELANLQCSSDSPFTFEETIATTGEITDYNTEWPYQTYNVDFDWAKLTAYYDSPETDSAIEKGFYYDQFIYLGQDTSCSNYNYIEARNGYQVYADNSVFAHTMYCKDKLTETTEPEDALIWEAKGYETGLFAIKASEICLGSFTYSNSNLNKVTPGWYYTTIFHFADGTIVMTEIKQKE